MTEVTPDTYATHARSLAILLFRTLESLQELGNPIAFYVLKTMQNLVPLAEQDKIVSIALSF